MKNLTKTAIVLIILGMMSIGTAFALSGGDLSRFSMAGTPENKQYQASASDVTELVVKASIADVTVTGADQSDIKIDYTEDRSINYNIKQEGSRLIMQSKGQFFFFNFWVFNPFGIFNSHKINITLPKELAAKVDVKSSTGSITVSDLNLKDNLKLDDSTGDIQLEKVKTSKDINVSASTGKISLDQVSGQNFDLSASTGDIRTKQTQASGTTFKANSSTGSLDIQDLNDVPDIELSSSTGDIKATIQGKRKDYQIDTKTMGNKTQENEDASKKVKAHSSTGNVNVQFSE